MALVGEMLGTGTAALPHPGGAVHAGVSEVLQYNAIVKRVVAVIVNWSPQDWAAQVTAGSNPRISLLESSAQQVHINILQPDDMKLIAHMQQGGTNNPLEQLEKVTALGHLVFSENLTGSLRSQSTEVLLGLVTHGIMHAR